MKLIFLIFLIFLASLGTQVLFVNVKNDIYINKLHQKPALNIETVLVLLVLMMVLWLPVYLIF